jgi:sugar lactone lactonase YvrE
MKRLTRFAFLCLLWVGVLLSSAGGLRGQMVTFTGSPVDFGNINICQGAKTTPAPCSASMTLNYKVTVNGTLGTPRVLTLGAFGGDFSPVSSTCKGPMTAGSTCVVQVKFAPGFAGLRPGAVEITDGSGNVVTTTLIHGVGIGPQISFDGMPTSQLVGDQNADIFWGGVAVDGYGDLFFPNGERAEEGVAPAVYELLDDGTLKTVGFGFTSPQEVAVDGAGTLYVTDFGTNMVVEIPPGCAASSCQRTLDGGFYHPYGIAVDGAGNLYVADSGNNRVVELPAGCISSACEIAIGKGWNFPFAVAVDSAGNVFVEDFANHRVERVAAGGGAQTTVVSNLQYSYGIAVDAAGDLFVADFGRQLIFEVPAGGGAPRTLASGLDQPQGITLDAAGNVYFSHFGSHQVISELRRGQYPYHTFASTIVGATSTDSPQTFTIANGGNKPLSFSRLLLEQNPDFIRETGPGTPADCDVSFSLAPGGSCDVTISFMPTEVGSLSGAVLMNDNDLNAGIATQMIYLAGTGTPTGASINFSGGFYSSLFGPAGGLTLNGGAAIHGTALQLTDGGTNESRSVFDYAPIGLSSFQTEFDFQLTGKDTLALDADGFAFVLQSNGPNALGSSGGGLGYGKPAIAQTGPSITNSVAIKFDLHNNDGEGSSSTGLYINGAAPTTPSINLSRDRIDLHSGHIFHVAVVYDGTTLTLTISDRTTHVTASLPFTVDIAGILGGPTGFAGFTGSTGEKTAVENILNWQLTSTECCQPGEPSFLTGFAPTSAITLNGQAQIADGSLELATDVPQEASSAFFSTLVPINKFTSDFDFVLSRETGEGFTFVVQLAGVHAVGSAASGLGYGMLPAGGTKIEHSVALKFDMHSDAGEGSNSTGVYVGGASPTVPSTSLAPSINLHSGHQFHARLNYDGVNLRVSITDLTQYAVFTGIYAVAIPAAVGGSNAYAGFTAGTGYFYDTIKILNWSMTSY